MAQRRAVRISTRKDLARKNKERKKEKKKMAIFKKTAPVEELIAKFKKLSDEEKEKFLQMTAADEDPAAESPESEEPESTTEAPEAPEASADGAEGAEASASEESEAEHKDPDDSPEEAESVADESDTEADTPEESEPAAEETPQLDVEALLARITAIEEQYATLSERITSLLDAADNKPFGGISPELSETDNDAVTEDDRIMKAYMAKQAYRR